MPTVDDEAPVATDRGLKRAAKRAVAPFERRMEIAVTRAVETAMRKESEALREALRADVATLVELTYELQRVADRLEAASRSSARSDTDAH
jgi:hypothetical protein